MGDIIEDDLDYCDANFRYMIEEKDGELCFTSFEVLGPLIGTKLGEVVTEYFRGRPLAKVRHADIARMRSAGDTRCLQHMVSHVLKLRSALGK